MAIVRSDNTGALDIIIGYKLNSHIFLNPCGKENIPWTSKSKDNSYYKLSGCWSCRVGEEIQQHGGYTKAKPFLVSCKFKEPLYHWTQKVQWQKTGPVMLYFRVGHFLTGSGRHNGNQAECELGLRVRLVLTTHIQTLGCLRLHTTSQAIQLTNKKPMVYHTSG